MASISDAVMERWFSPAFRRDRPDVVGAWRLLFTRTPAEGYVAACEAVRDAELTSLAARIAVPTRFAVGAEDVATPPDLVRSAAELVTGARFDLLEGAGHLASVERTDPLPRSFMPNLRRSLMPDGETDSIGSAIAVRRRVLGDAHVDREAAGRTAFDAPFQELIIRSAWGSVWSRPDLTPRERSMVTIALLAALGHHEELAMHIRSTRTPGLPRRTCANACSTSRSMPVCPPRTPRSGSPRRCSPSRAATQKGEGT